MTSQADAIALYLKSGHDLTALQALELFGCLRLAARVKDLRKRGLPIETLDLESNGKRYAAYRLRRPVQHTLFDLSEATPTGSALPVGERAVAPL